MAGRVVGGWACVGVAVATLLTAVDGAAQDRSGGALEAGLTLSGFADYPEHMRRRTDDVLGTVGAGLTWWASPHVALRVGLVRGFATRDDNCCPLALDPPVGPGLRVTTVTANDGDIGMDFWNPTVRVVVDPTPQWDLAVRGWVGGGRLTGRGLSHALAGVGVRRGLGTFTAVLGVEAWLYAYDEHTREVVYDEDLVPVPVRSDLVNELAYPVQLTLTVERRIR